MPIPLGILAQFRQAAAGAFDLLETQVLTSNQSSVTFSGLSAYASQYKHLQVRAVARGTGSGTTDYIGMRFNGDTGNNYSWHGLVGFGSLISINGANVNGCLLADIVGSGGATNAYGAAVIDILDPFVTTKNKTVRSLAGQNLVIGLFSSAWRSNDAVNSLTFYEYENAGSFATGSRFSLYGVKG